MQEVNEAPLAAPITAGSLTDSVVEHAVKHPDQTALRRHVDGTWTDVSAKQFHDEVVALAKGLIAAGIGHGDRIAIMSATRYEWTLADYAGWFVGATVVPIYERPRPSRWSGSCPTPAASASSWRPTGTSRRSPRLRTGCPRSTSGSWTKAQWTS